MKIQELTLEHFQDYIFENLEKVIMFQVPKEIRQLNKQDFLERFELTTGTYKEFEAYSYILFRMRIELDEIVEICNITVKSLFDGFIKKYNPTNIKVYFVNLGYYCTNDKQFELELRMYSEI